MRSPEWLRLEPMPPSPLLHPYTISADLVWKRAKKPLASLSVFFSRFISFIFAPLVRKKLQVRGI